MMRTVGLAFALASALILGLVGCAGLPVTQTPSPPKALVGAVGARDAAMSYIYEHYHLPPVEEMAAEWEEEDLTSEGLVGSAKFRYTVESWVVEVSYPIVAPEATVYQVSVTNEHLGFEWQGAVDAEGTVTELAPPTEAQAVACWYGRVVDLPEGAQFDDYLALQPEGAGEIGVEGGDAEIEAEISALGGKEEPWNYAHFWGAVTCDVLDYGGCQLLVERLRPEGPEGPFFGPEAVEGWQGTIVSNPPDAQFDDFFVLAGDFPVGYGIDSSDPELAAQLESLRDTGTTVHVWGEVTCPAIDSFGTHMVVTRMEVEGQAEEPGGGVQFGEASVESIEILILESFPVQVHVVAKGQLPDACIEIDQITEERQGNAFLVTISTVRLPDARCAPTPVPFEEVIALDVVGLPAGSYTVEVDGVSGSFELEMDNVARE